MRKVNLYFSVFLNFFLLYKGYSQVAAPEIRCISVTSPTSAVVTWIAPADPSNEFTQYQIWSSGSQTGPFTLVGTVSSISQTSYTHTPSNVGLQSQYYYITTISSAGTNTSVPSATVRSVFLNLSNPGNGIVSLNWNALATPLLPSSSPTYTLSRTKTTGSWNPLYVGSSLSYKDTIDLCKVYYNYKVEISDASGCISVSNLNGDTCYNRFPPNRLSLDSVSVNSSGQTLLGWPASTSKDVVAYIIYKSNGVSVVAIDTIYGYNNTSFTYTASGASTASEGYVIASVDSCGIYSIPSPLHNTMFLNAPVYDLCSRTANLAWTTYTNMPKGVLKYEVYCKVNGGAYTLVGSSSNGAFSHSGLSPGDTYCYIVRVWNSDLSISASSNVQCFVATGLPGPSYVYINSVSVNTINKQIEVTYSVDTTKSFNGCVIYKSIDLGVSFTKLATVTATISPYTFIDKDVKSTDKNYYYKVQVADDCDNPGAVSNISKNIVLKVNNDNESVFKNNLTWDDYTTWSGGVESFNIYRSINGVFDPTPIINVPFLTSTYTDNVQDYVSDQGKFSYYVEAVEGIGNVYGFKDLAKSNPADAYLEVNVFVPNAFSPKGINNVWLPIAQYVEKTDYKVKVFNRWGVKIFETQSDTEGWTGDAATDDVYVYLIEYKNARGEYIQLKGHLNIIR